MLPSEPQSIGGVLDAGFHVFRTTFKSVAIPAAIMAVILAALTLGMASSFDIEAIAAMQNPAPGAAPVLLPPIGPLFWILWALYIASFVTLFVVVARHQWALIKGRDPSLGEDFMHALALLVPLLVASALYYLSIVVGLILLIIPGLIVMVSMSLYAFVPIVEDRRAWTSITRSHALVWGGNWFRTAAVLTVLMAISIALTFTLELILGASTGIASIMEPGAPNPFVTVAGAVLTVVLYPLFTAVMLALYNDLLLRKEAGDLDARLQALDEPSA